jgi:Na+-transporting NADH:ubiquinone oxidoreductase subunit NqrD
VRPAKLANAGLGVISSLNDEVSEYSGMKRGSVFIYLIILSNLIKGEPNTLTMKFKDLQSLMGKIESQLGENVYRDAIHSLEQSISYWRKKIPGSFANKVEALCREYYQNLKR